jgi:hypothetical protein
MSRCKNRKHDVNASHQAWLKAWMPKPVLISVTYEEVWWETNEDGDPEEHPCEERGYVSYTICPNPNVRGLDHCTDALWGDEFRAWFDESRDMLEYEYTVADAARLVESWWDEVYSTELHDVIQDRCDPNQDYRTGHYRNECLEIGSRTAEVMFLADAIRAGRIDPLDLP